VVRQPDTHPGASFFLGAPEETWDKLGRGGPSEDGRENATALISRSFAKAVEECFGDPGVAQDAGPSDAPDEEWTRSSIEIRYPAGQWPNAGCVLSPAFEEALMPENKKSAAPVVQPATSPAARKNSSDLLMHVQFQSRSPSAPPRFA